MSHIRKQIRSAIVALLTGLDTTGVRVYAGYPYPAETLPCLFIYTPSEEISLDEMGSDREQERRISVVIEGHCKGASIQDDFDDIAQEVEVALFADQFLSDLAAGIDLDNTEEEITGDMEEQAGNIRLNFTVHARTLKGSPSVAI